MTAVVDAYTIPRMTHSLLALEGGRIVARSLAGRVLFDITPELARELVAAGHLHICTAIREAA